MQTRLLFPTPVTSLDQFKQILLKNRGISDDQEFFQPLDPLELTLKEVGLKSSEMTKALKLIQKHKQGKILIFGDYDADGISATAVLWLSLHTLGYQATPFIPHRTKHGYGISDKALDDILATGQPDLIITVDNGIVAHRPLQRLKDLGIPVIVTDHHQPEDHLPPASVIVHTTQLCGTTVSWMLSRELLRAELSREGAEAAARSLLDLCSIATIADQVPLLHANRSFAVWGLRELQKGLRPGLAALCQTAQVKYDQITTTTVNYVLAPRLNAMGRLEHGMDALRLLCTGNLAKATEYAKVLNTANLKRQSLTQEMMETAEAQTQADLNQSIIIVASPEFHEGIIGLLAGRLMEKYYKPAVAIAVGPTTSKGSARSIAGVNIVKLIRQVRDDLLEVGGHPMAAGFGLESSKIESVKKRLQKLAKTQIKATLLEPAVTVDAEIDPHLITLQLAQLIQEFAPFGQGNPEPTVLIKGAQLVQISYIGKEEQHVKAIFNLANGSLTALAWRARTMFAELEELQRLDIIGSLEINEWKNKKSLQLKIDSVSIHTQSSITG